MRPSGRVLAFAVAITGAVGVWGSSRLPALSAQQTAPVTVPTAGAAARIAGIVVSDGEGAASAAVNRAFVTLSGGGLGRVVLSDGDGRFAFGALPDGSYLVTAAKAGYVTSAYGALRVGGEGTPVVVRAGQTLAELRVPLARGAVITGTIMDGDGAPAPNLRVTARRSGSGSARPPRPQPFETTLTDDRGTYRVFGLSPGEYVVEATPEVATGGGMRTMSTVAVDAELADLARIYSRGRGVPVIASPGPGRSEAAQIAGSLSYAPVFYPSTTNAAAAVPIAVRAGEERTGVDFSLVLAGTTVISGTVVGAGGETVTGVQVVAIRTGSSAAPLGLRPTPAGARGPDGAFRIVNVTPGRYTVQARTVAPGTGTTPSRVSQWASEDVEIVGSAITGLVLRLQPAKTFSGRVAFDRTTLSAPADLTAIGIALRLSAAELQGVFAPPRAAVRADGTFQVDGMTPGTYDLDVSAPVGPAPGWWLRSVVLEGHDLLDERVVMTAASSSVTGAIVTFSDRHTSLSGSLENLAGRPAPEYIVIAFTPDRRLWPSASRRIVAARPSTDGHFVFPDLPPGQYLLAVVTDVEPNAWHQSDFLEALSKTSVAVTIGEGEQKVQALRVGR